MFSPTQSFTRLTSSSRGRTALPPSHPHAATTDATPPAIPSFRKSRRSSRADALSGRRDSVMRGKPPAIPSAEHCAQRCRIDDEYENDVHEQKGGEDPHGPEVPVARGLESAEQLYQPGQLRRFVDREAREDRQRAQEGDGRVRELLQRVVLALRGGVFLGSQIVILHLDRAAHVAVEM